MASCRPNKRLFAQMNNSDEEDQELVKAEILYSSKKINKKIRQFYYNKEKN